jgi:tetratricopeptide (TPR) repeat protein
MALSMSTPLNEDQAFDSALEALSSGHAESGLSILLPFIKAGTSNYGLWHLHGLILRQMARRKEAIESLQRAASLAPGSAKIAHALARTLYEAGLPSVDAYGRALRLAPTDTEVLAGLTSAFVAAGDVSSAINGLDRILTRSPHWIAGHILLAKLRWAQGERDSFARSFEAALKSMPQNINLWRELIVALMHAEQWTETLRVIATGRAAIGDHPVFGINEAAVYAELGELERAELLFAPYAESNDGPVQIRRVRLYLRLGRADEADRIIARWTNRPEAFMFWPYASIAWRMLDDPRWQWLEGDERFVGVYDIADRLPPLDVLAERLRQLHTLSGQPLEQSLRGGTQTDGDLFTHIDPVLVKLREAVRITVDEHVARFPPRDAKHPLLAPPRGPIRFSGAWSVRLNTGGFHANHVHPMGWISSALYIVLPPDLGTREAGFLALGDPRVPSFPIDLPPFRTIEPKPGRLALFPSYTFHGTRPFSEGERMTVAFDVAIPGQHPSPGISG